MAIKGLTDKGAVIPPIGELRKGAARTDNGIGRDLTYFRFTSQNPEVVEAFSKAYGNEPTSVEVYLPYQTVEQNLECWKEHWVAGGLKHRCDGETCVLWQDDKGKYQDSPKQCPGYCKPVARLHCVVPALERFGTVTALTTSINDIITLNASLQAIYMFRGELRGIPFILSRRPRKIGMPGSNGTRRRVEKALLFIEPSPAWFGMQLAAAQREALMLTEGEIEELSPVETGANLEPGGDPFEEVEQEAGPETTGASETKSEPPEKIRERGKRLALINAVQKQNGIYLVTDGKGTFEVSQSKGTIRCTCPNYLQHSQQDPNYMCEHIVAVKENVAIG